MGDELAVWLRGVHEHVEQIARDAATRSATWVVEEARPHRWGEHERDADVLVGGKPAVRCDTEYGGYLLASHIELHDPAAVLARVAAERAILALLDDPGPGDPPRSAVSGQWHRPDFQDGWRLAARSAVRALAAGWSTMPGYLAEWAPADDAPPSPVVSDDAPARGTWDDAVAIRNSFNRAMLRRIDEELTTQRQAGQAAELRRLFGTRHTGGEAPDLT